MQTLDTDVVVIGGGATGAGVVRDCAMRGFSTVLLERADIGQGTSARYHGLLHSGGRYVISDPRPWKPGWLVKKSPWVRPGAKNRA